MPARSCDDVLVSPGPTVAADDPLAQLSPYELRFLPAHLEAAGDATRLHRLLSLRRGDAANAWYAATDGVAAYLADLGRAWHMATVGGDSAMSVRYAFVAGAVRRAASIPAGMLDALVTRGRLTLDEAISMADSAADRDDRVEGLIRLLPRLAADRRRDLAARVLEHLATRTENRTAVGGNAGELELPLGARQQVDAVERLVAIPEVDPERLAAVARQTGTGYGAARALAVAAGRLAGAARAAAFDEAWERASALRPFDGRPEAQAFVAAHDLGETGRQRVSTALESALDVLADSPERLKYHDYSPYADAPAYGRALLLRLESFAQSLRDLAPLLDLRQVHAVLARTRAIPGRHGVFGTFAVLPRLAALAHPDEALQIALDHGPLSLLALTHLMRAGVALPGGASSAGMLEIVETIEDEQIRALSLVSLAAVVLEEERAGAIRLAMGATLAADRFELRDALFERLLEPIRSLAPAHREPLLDDVAAACEDLVQSPDEAEALLSQLDGALSDRLLDERFRARRSVRIATRVSELALRDPAPAAARLPSGGPLGPAAAAAALDAVARAEPADRAPMLVFLAALLDADARADARELARAIPRSQLRAEPLWRLAERDPAPGEGDLAECLKTVFDVFGGLARVCGLVDGIAAALASAPPPEVAAARAELDAFLAEQPDAADVAAAVPVATALSGPEVGARVAETFDDLAAWLGASAEVPVDGEDEEPRRVLAIDAGAGGLQLVGALAAAKRWSAAGECLERLRTVAGADESLRRAERTVVERLAPPGGGAASSDPAHVALVESIAARAGGPSEAHAALLRRVVRRRDRRGTERLLAGVEAAGEVPPAFAADVAAAELLIGKRERAAARLVERLDAPGAYDPAAGRVVARMARELQAHLDADGAPSAAGERALDAYLAYVGEHGEDYALREAAGTLLHDRVLAATAANRAVDTRWLDRLDVLADADDPGETLLHDLAVGAARAAGDAARARARVRRRARA
jgi:hypothetical protein